MPRKTSLASALAVIGREANELETRAMQVLHIVKRDKITDVKAWSAAVRAAYKANGWNGKPGKPKAGSTAKAVPVTVKQYVSAVRAAFRLKLPVASYSSFYALRQDLAKQRAKARKPVNGHAKPELAGVQVSRPDELTGGPFHDLVVLYGALDRGRQTHMLAALDRVKRQFAMSAPQLVIASMPEMRKAA